VSRLEVHESYDWIDDVFQSRAGFSECLDDSDGNIVNDVDKFQSRAGFSECLDLRQSSSERSTHSFQSRAGFSECLDASKNSKTRSGRVSIPCWVF